jgi:Cu2+-exporting ATPase
LAIDGESQWFATIDHQAQPMCCPGCKTVAETILLGGLSDYYKYRTEPASQASSEDINHADYSLYDDETFQQQWVHHDDNGQAECQLIIGDIHCAACVWLLEQRLQQLDGLSSIQISLSDHSALIRWQVGTLKLSELFHAIDQIGYSAYPFNADNRQQLEEKENRQSLRRLGVAGIAMMQAGMFSIALYAGDFQGIATEHQQLLRWFSLLIVSVVMLYCAQPFFIGAVRALRQHSLNMDVPISLALLGAYAASAVNTYTGTGEVYFDSITMFSFFLLVARHLERRARHSQRILSHQAILPSTCKRLASNHSIEQVPLSNLQTGDNILLRPGETICADGIILSGKAAIDESSFTGEFMPIERSKGDPVMAGTINTDGSLTIEVTATGQKTSFSAIEKLLARAQSEKPKAALMADLIARYFTAVVLIATAIAGSYWALHAPEHAFEICLAMLVVSCPCALSLATPSALTISTLQLRQAGLLITKSHVLEQADTIDTVCLDKTGTLTEGKLAIENAACFADLSADKCLQIAAALEAHSEHPIAKAFKHPQQQSIAEQAEIISGKGVEGCVDQQQYRIGSLNYCHEWIDTPPPHQPTQQNQCVYLVNQHTWLAVFTLNDQLREDAFEVIQSLNSKGLKTILLTGDSSDNAVQLARDLGINECKNACSPEDKLNTIETLRLQGHKVMMIGDGINDIPVLAAADISIAMNSASDTAKIQADAAMLTDKLSVLPLLLEQARATRRNIKQNLGWALCYNACALPLAAIGWVPPYLAAIGMSFSSLLVILNARRLRRPIQRYLSRQN